MPSEIGKAARREAASLLLSRRPARVEAAALAVCQLCRRHVESVGAKDALRPTGRGRGAEGAPSSESSGWSDQPQPPDQCPAGEAINSNHRTGAQREKDLRQTPTAGRGPRTKDLRQTPSFRPVLLAESYVKSAAAAIPSWETFQRANHPSSQTRATGIAPPGFYGRKPWLKAKQCRHYYPPKTRCEGFRAVHANIVHKTSRKFTGSRTGTTRRAISTRV